MINRKISFFIEVVEKGSFSKAAKEFYISQSAISQQIVQLEEELGAYLFDRSGYRPVLTKAGEYYYDECKKLLDKYSSIEENVKKLGKASKKRLSIGITGPLENKHLPHIISEYKNIYSDVSIEVRKIKFGSGVAQLEEGKLDVCFGILNDFNGKSNIKTLNLLNHKVCVICSKDNPLAKRKSVESLEIAKEPIVCFSKSLGKLFYLDFIESFKKDGVMPNIVQEVDELEELLLAVKINTGIAFVSKEVIEEDEDISVLDIANTHHHASFCIGYLNKNNKKYISDFIDITSKYFENLKKEYKKN